MSKHTAVEYLAQSVIVLGVLSPSEVIKAIQLEREQIEEAYNQGFRDAECEDVIKEDVSLFADAKIYYTQTYGECTHQ